VNDDSCYLALGLGRDAPSEEIRKAYRNLSMKLHPDASGTAATALGFTRTVRAYKVLTAAKSRVSPGTLRTTLSVLDSATKTDVFKLGQILVSAQDAKERSEAAKYLGLSGKRSVWVFLRKGLYDSDERVICSCIRAAAVLGLAQGGSEIAGAWQRSSLTCRKTILKIAEATRSELLLPVLKAAQQSEQPELRLASRRLLREYSQDHSA